MIIIYNELKKYDTIFYLYYKQWLSQMTRQLIYAKINIQKQKKNEKENKNI